MKQYRENELRTSLLFCLNNMHRYFIFLFMYLEDCNGKTKLSDIIHRAFPCLFATVQVYVRIRKSVFTRTEREMDGEGSGEEGFA